MLLVLLLVAGAGLGVAYAWTRTQFYVGVAGDQVAIYQGLPDGIPGVSLSRVYKVQELPVSALPPYYATRVRGNIEVADLAAAEATVDELKAAVRRCAAEATPTPTPTPTTPAPTPRPTAAPSAPTATASAVVTASPAPTPVPTGPEC